MKMKKLNWIKVCIAPRLIKLDYEDTIKKERKYIFVYEKTNEVDSLWRTFYNIGLFRQESWYPIETEDLKDILEFMKKFDNVSIINADK